MRRLFRISLALVAEWTSGIYLLLDDFGWILSLFDMINWWVFLGKSDFEVKVSKDFGPVEGERNTRVVFLLWASIQQWNPEDVQKSGSLETPAPTGIGAGWWETFTGMSFSDPSSLRKCCSMLTYDIEPFSTKCSCIVFSMRMLSLIAVSCRPKSLSLSLSIGVSFFAVHVDIKEKRVTQKIRLTTVPVISVQSLWSCLLSCIFVILY